MLRSRLGLPNTRLLSTKSMPPAVWVTVTVLEDKREEFLKVRGKAARILLLLISPHVACFLFVNRSTFSRAKERAAFALTCSIRAMAFIPSMRCTRMEAAAYHKTLLIQGWADFKAANMDTVGASQTVIKCESLHP